LDVPRYKKGTGQRIGQGGEGMKKGGKKKIHADYWFKEVAAGLQEKGKEKVVCNYPWGKKEEGAPVPRRKCGRRRK